MLIDVKLKPRNKAEESNFFYYHNLKNIAENFDQDNMSNFEPQRMNQFKNHIISITTKKTYFDNCDGSNINIEVIVSTKRKNFEATHIRRTRET